MTSYHAWCLTLNNPGPWETHQIEESFSSAQRSELYAIIGKEGYSFGYGPKRTPHLQMCVVYAAAKTFYEMKKIFRRAHIEVMRYDLRLASDYCKKEGIYTEYGNIEEACWFLKEVSMMKAKYAPMQSQASSTEGLPQVRRKVSDGITGVSITPVMPNPVLPNGLPKWCTPQPKPIVKRRGYSEQEELLDEADKWQRKVWGIKTTNNNNIK